MKKGWIIFFVTLGIVLMILAMYISITNDRIEVETKNVNVIDFYGKKSDYTVLIYSEKYKLKKAFSELLYTLGIAILVYFIVENLLKSYDRKLDAKENKDNMEKMNALHEKINKDVFDGVLKKIIPDELFDVLASDILHKDIIRRNTTWDYEINDMIEGVELKQLVMYDFCSMSDLMRSIPLRITTTQNGSHTSALEYIKLLKMDGSLIFEENKEEIKLISNENEHKYVKEIELQPKQSVKVIYSVKNLYTSKEITDCHYSIYSSLNFQLKVRKSKNLKFTAMGTFSRNLEIEFSDDEKIIYKHVKGILAGQAIVFLLEPKKEIKLLSQVKHAAV